MSGIYIIIIWVGLALVLVNSKHEITFDHSGSWLVDLSRKLARHFPDDETVIFYGFEPQNATIHYHILERLTRGDPVPSVRSMKANIDSFMDALVQRAEIMSKPLEWRDITFLPNLANPSVVYTHEGRLLMSWRDALYDAPIKFGWVNRNRRRLGSADLRQNSKIIPASDQLNLSIHVDPPGAFQEDARLFMLRNRSVLVQFTYKEHLFAPTCMSFALLTPTPSGSYVASRSVYMDNHPLHFPQKNWTPLEHDGQLFFVSVINPPIVLQYESTNATGHAAMSLMYASGAPLDVSLPWNKDYGWPIRGGTPAIEIGANLFLSFFHTSMVSAMHPSKSYFMGAVTFCVSHTSFQIHAMSPMPIVLRDFYEGEWISWPTSKRPGLDYVVFPIGLTLSMDKKAVVLSLGWQDKHGVMATFDLAQLLESLELVKECVV
eukprot:gene31581-38169_t